jgi:anti-anti-sigma factor
MALECQSSDDTSTIELTGALDISSAADLRQLLMARMESSRRLCIDLSQASRVDVTAVQILWAARRHAGQHGIELHFIAPIDEEVQTSLDHAGIAPFWRDENAQGATADGDGK